MLCSRRLHLSQGGIMEGFKTGLGTLDFYFRKSILHRAKRNGGRWKGLEHPSRDN